MRADELRSGQNDEALDGHCGGSASLAGDEFGGKLVDLLDWSSRVIKTGKHGASFYRHRVSKGAAR